ncbi:MAG: glutamate racemase [Betaproteobacteria bacterium]|nr:glutamate racemase [Betaproteobacteria bacterium]
MIGVFDSGLGGLSVLAAISRALPTADLTYLADSAHLPYGAKPDEFIRGRVLAIGRHLAERGCGLLVVACNTATAAAVQALRDQHPDIPVVGIEPGIKPAAISSKTRHIAVLTTESTAQSARLTHLIDNHANGLKVQIVACPGWATRIESLDMEDPTFSDEVTAKIVPLLEQGVDRLVLGCTHYSFLLPLLEPLTAGRAELVDVAAAVARQVLRLSGLHARGTGRLTMLATARPERLHRAPQALGLSNLTCRLNSATHQVLI